MVASGNDFVVVYGLKYSGSLPALAKRICSRKFGIGADGLLVLQSSRSADLRMRIFNADGSQANMCGNGARCAALYSLAQIADNQGKVQIETNAGIIESEVKNNKVKIKFTEPGDIKLDIPIKVAGRIIKVNYIDTGVPHAVVFVQGLAKIDAAAIGRQIRYHQAFAPKGANVDFVEILSKDSIGVRTYERGVEDETLACGTGSAASALIFSLKTNALHKVMVHTKSKEILTIYFARVFNKFKNVWLEGKVRIVYQGVYYV